MDGDGDIVGGGVIPQGGVGLPATAAFVVDPVVPADQKRGILLGYFDANE